ncbi:MAG: alpha/beta hydrolase [Clostridium sp.]|nr:alpha/beta hydrolase [Clostridium sp.]
MRKIIMIIVIILVLFIILGLGIAGNYLYNLAINPNVLKDIVFNSSKNDVSQEETSGDITEKTKAWLKDEVVYNHVYMISNDGLKLHNYEIINDNPSNKWAIIVHGYTSNGLDMASYAEKFYNMGYNIMIPDLRSHGESEGHYIGMGWDDRNDIINLINYLIKKDSEAEIVLFGVSMGAATVMMVSGEELPSNVKAVIEDCGYTSAWDQFTYQLKVLFNLPQFPMMNIADVICKIRAGYFISNASAIKQVEKSVTPTLFIHGDNDDFVPFEMQDELYKSCNAEKEKIIIQGAAHAKSASTNPELYWTSIADFLEKYVQ